MVEFEKLQEEISTLEKSQKRLEDEVASIEETVADYNSQIEAAQTGSSKELMDLSEAVESRKSQQFKLEDEILTLMEELQPKTEKQSVSEAEHQELQKRSRSLEEEITKKLGSIKADLEGLTAKRAELTSQIAANIIDTYEKLRTHHDGIGVARLEGDKCFGCDLNMTHPPGEIEQLKNVPEDGIPQCTECQRILVISEAD